jgi:hypothetical protein
LLHFCLITILDCFAYELSEYRFFLAKRSKGMYMCRTACIHCKTSQKIPALCAGLLKQFCKHVVARFSSKNSPFNIAFTQWRRFQSRPLGKSISPPECYILIMIVFVLFNWCVYVVQGIPLHLQIDTYEDLGVADAEPIHRAFCQIKIFRDKVSCSN